MFWVGEHSLKIPAPLALTVCDYDIMKIWRKRLPYLQTQLINEEAVYRTALATPGLLIIK